MKNETAMPRRLAVHDNPPTFDAKETVAAAPLMLTLCWRAGRIARLDLATAARDVLPPDASPAARRIQAALARLSAGRPAEFPEFPLDWDALPPFTRLALQTLRERVGHGETISYGGLAALVGRPNAARAVGRAMARNPWPLVVPCHRVLGARGGLTGYSNPEGLRLKALLLRLEGARGEVET